VPNLLKKRTLVYRKAEWLVPYNKDGTRQTLEDVVRFIHQVRSTQDMRKVDYGDGIAEGRHCEPKTAGFYLHIAKHTPGEHATVARHMPGVRAADLEVIAPPNGCEFVDGDLMVRISGDDVITCQSRLHDAALGIYIRGMAELAGMQPEAANFQLVKKANLIKLGCCKKKVLRRFD
jgi:hypothetical protein